MMSTNSPTNETCHLCQTVMSLGKSIITTREVITELLGSQCKDSPSFSARACHGALELNADPVLWLFKNSQLQSEELCGLMVGHQCLEYLNFPNSTRDSNKKVKLLYYVILYYM